MFKVRQIVKAWFNQIDILKKWRFLNDNTSLFHDRKTKSRIFKAWRQEIRMKKAFMQVAEKHIINENKFWFKEFKTAARLNKVFEIVAKKHLVAER